VVSKPRTKVTILKLRVRYNHSKRKNHTKLFTKTLSHLPKPLFSASPPLFKEKEVFLTTYIMSSRGNKGNKKTTFNPDVPPFKWSEIADGNTGIGSIATPSTSQRPRSNYTSSLAAYKPERDPLSY
jgi:hypothetical protein